jgi:hypothetical protein
VTVFVLIGMGGKNSREGGEMVGNGDESMLVRGSFRSVV